jgi:hypothetical protein
MTFFEQYFLILKVISIYAIGIAALCLISYILVNQALKSYNNSLKIARQKRHLQRQKLFNYKFNNKVA